MIPILRASDAGELKRRVMNRSQLQNEEVSRIVKEIVARVRQEGDAALFDYTAKFDHVTMTAETVLVTKDVSFFGAKIGQNCLSKPFKKITQGICTNLWLCMKL